LKKTTREIGHKLEQYISDFLFTIDNTAKPTKASGASTQIGDVLSKYFFVEAKKTNKENIIIKSKVWNKLLAEMPQGSLKIPLYINQNAKNETLVTLDIKDFIEIAKNYCNQ
jgi:hypothetical protein